MTGPGTVPPWDRPPVWGLDDVIEHYEREAARKA